MKWICIQVLLLQNFDFLFVSSQPALINTPIKVLPPEAGCSKGTIQLPEYLERRYLRNFQNVSEVKVNCSKNTSCKTTNSNVTKILSTGPLAIGQDGCTMTDPRIQSPNGTIGPRMDTDQRSPAGYQLCFTDLISPIPSVLETILVKFKLDSPKARGTLLDLFDFRLDVEQNKLHFRHFGYQQNVELPLKDGWNQIAIQINNTAGYVGYYSFFLEGELQMILPVRRTSRRRRQPRPPSIRPFRVGLPTNVGPQFGQCLLVENDICRNSNASSFYSLPNRYTSDKNENEKMFQRSLEAYIKLCPNTNRESLEDYLCSLYFRRCQGDSIPVEPCSEFCEAITMDCPELKNFPPFNCSSYNSTNCINQFQSGLSLLKGEVHSIEIYEGILVDQEIYRNHTGRLPDVSRPECLCPETAAHLSAQCYDDTSAFYPRIPTFVGITRNGTQQGLLLMVEFLPEYMNDGKLLPFDNGDLSAWFSAPGMESFTVEIGLEEQNLITSVDIHLLKPMPSKSLSIELRQKNEWKVIHRFANNCEDFGFPPFVIAERPDIVGCTPYEMAGVQGAGFNSNYILSWNLFNYTFGFGSYWDMGDERVLEFFRNGAVRVVFDGPPLGNFTSKEEIYHAITEIDVTQREFAKSPCNCYSDGIVPRGQCSDDFQCPCIPEMDLKKAGKQCLPYIDIIYPTYGPKAGSTLIVIQGGGFGNSTRSVTIGGRNCAVNTTLSNSTMTVCDTLPLRDNSLLGEPLVIRIHLANKFTINYRHPFTYKPDPVIEDIYPRKSITVGGVLQTVIGENLDSVAFPQLIVYMKEANRPEIIYLRPHICHVRNSTLMECPAPVIPLPSSYKHLNKRSVAEQEVKISVGNDGFHSNSGFDVRHKRQTKNWINDNQLDWHMGLILDGVKTYLNLSESLPGKSQLLIFTSPKLDYFDPEVQVFKIHKGQKTISLQGEKLQYGVQEDDYHISVGNGVCEMRQLLNNLVVCSPPSDEVPSAQEIDIHESGAVRVQVRIGKWYVFHVGFLRYEFTLWDNPAFKGGVIAAIIIVLLLLLLAYPAYKFIKGKRKSKEDGLGYKVSYYRKENPYVDRRNLLNRIDPALKMKITPCLIDADKLSCHSEIGKGNFGVVYVGDLKDKDDVYKVAVKTIKEQDATLTMISEFLGEASVMKEFDNKNVLSLIGIVIKRLDVYVVLPFMENGSLKDFVQNKANTFTVLDLVHLSSQACDGMAYLESQKFVHRDLAARNCMVDELKNVKIADFGLARDIYEQEYYRPEDKQRPLPYKWMAIECVVLDSKKFTMKSDVWSFGVLLWEVLTRGRTPYSEIPAGQFGRYLRSNGRLERPAHCPDAVYEIMMSCWRANPNDRPNFSDLVEIFEELLSPYFSNDKPAIPGYTRLSTMASQDIQSSGDYSNANYTRDYLELVDTPTIDDLLLPEQPKEQNGGAQQSRGQNNTDSSGSNGSTNIPLTPPPVPHAKPQVPKKPANIPAFPRQPSDEGYMVAQ